MKKKTGNKLLDDSAILTKPEAKRSYYDYIYKLKEVD